MYSNWKSEGLAKLEGGRLQEGEEEEKKQPRQPLPRKIVDLFAISDKCNGRLVVHINDNKVDVEDEPGVHLLDPDVVPVEVLLHHKHEPIKDHLRGESRDIAKSHVPHRPCYKTSQWSLDIFRTLFT